MEEQNGWYCLSRSYVKKMVEAFVVLREREAQSQTRREGMGLLQIFMSPR